VEQASRSRGEFEGPIWFGREEKKDEKIKMKMRTQSLTGHKMTVRDG
jgi:hypothetical protein